jgi:hypothetical protein
MNYTSSRCNTRLSFVILRLATAILLGGTSLAQGTFVSFDGPNAGTQQFHGTFPVAINPWGGVALTTVADSGSSHAYVRHPNGTFLEIHPPNTLGTYVSGLNAHGQVAGVFSDTTQTLGYIRNVDGTYVILNPPGSTGLASLVGINDAGQVAGNAYIGGATTPFFWDPAQPNTYVTFSGPGGSAAYAAAINASGQIAGAYAVGCCQANGFLRNTDGTFSTFALPLLLGYANLQIVAMNKWGTILCSFFDENGSDSAVLLRYSGGGKKYVFGNSHGGLNPAAISDKGVVVGTDFPGDVSYGNAFSIDRTLHETLIPIPFTSQGSTANAVNTVGQMTGTYIDANGASHGWIYLP